MLREPVRAVRCRGNVRLILVGVVLVALIAPVAATGDLASSGKAPDTVLALGRSTRSDFLVRLDGVSLKPLSRRLSLGGHSYAWSFSPDNKRLALGVDRALGIRIVDVRRLRRVGRIETWNGDVQALAWLSPRRIVGVENTGLFAVDPVAKKRLRLPLDGEIVLTQRAGSMLALIVAPYEDIGPARLALVGADGRVRTVTLDRIRAGTKVDEESMRGKSKRPGLAVDPAGRVFVFGSGDEPIAEVDRTTLEVTYRRAEHPRSLTARFGDWLDPAAEAKVPLSGSSRTAAWLGDGRIALWGSDSIPAGPDRIETTSIGLSIVDTRSWTIRTVDSDAVQVALTADTLLSAGDGSGLTAYSTDGDRRYQLFAGEKVGIAATFGSRAFVGPGRGRVRIVDVTTGRLLGTRRAVPQILHSDFCWW
jgi:hypothetical protein